MAFKLEGDLAVVTGATRGIGKAMAIALAEAGSHVVLIQRDATQTSTLDAIKALGKRAWIYEADLSSADSVKAACNKILVQDKLDISILVNCAGIQFRSPSHLFPDDSWNTVLQVNLSTVFIMCREFGAYMLNRPLLPDKRRGSIINIGSLLSFQGGYTVPAYAAAKGGIAQLTKALSNEWASSRVNVNAIAPGYIDTEMNTALMNDEKRQAEILSRIPAGRWGKPQDFCGPVVFLASRASDYISGEVLVVDGGWMGR